MNNRPEHDPAEFTQDLYDLMGRNTQFMTPKRFFDKYILSDGAFMVDADEKRIYLDEFDIVLVPKSFTPSPEDQL